MVYAYTNDNSCSNNDTMFIYVYTSLYITLSTYIFYMYVYYILQSKYEALLSIKDEDDRTAAKIRLEIIDNILTLKCPRCQIAFCDYDGCAALSCGINTCRCGFCAYCLTDCGTDAHAHVPRCPENTKGIYLNLADFKVLHSRKRGVRIRERLQRVSNDIR